MSIIFSQRIAFLTLLLDRNLSTKEAEREVGTTRVANLATDARRLYGLTLPCYRRDYRDNQGRGRWYGVYTLTNEDRKIVVEILGGVNG